MTAKYLKRGASFLLALVMVLTMLPVNSFAVGTADSEEKSAVEGYQESINEMLEWYLGDTSMSREQIEAVVSEMDADNARIALVEIVELTEAMEAELTEAEYTAILEANPALAHLAELLIARNQNANVLAGSVSLLDGKVSVTDDLGTAAIEGGTVTITATGNAFTLKANTITVTNETTGPATLSFSYEVVNYNSFSIADTAVNASGAYTALLAAGESLILKLDTKGKAVLTLSDLSLVAAAESSDVTVHYDSTLGSITVGGAAVSDGYVAEDVKLAEGVLLSVETVGDKVAFLGWMNADKNVLLSTETSYRLYPAMEMTVEAVFVSTTGNAWFRVDNKLFQDLNEADAYAAGNVVKTIVLAADGILPAGDYTISSGVTLLIPFDAKNTLYRETPDCSTVGSVNVDWVQPTAYRTLTMVSGAKITANGAISISGQHAASNGGGAYCGVPTGPLGWVKMESGSGIVLNSGANLYAWGYIQGSGTVTAKSGATVHENFQFTDFRGGSNTLSLVNTGLVFPINQYYVQNIEVPVTFEAGSNEYIFTSVFMSGNCAGGAAKFIGDKGMFVAENGGYVVKDYIENRDRMQVDLYGNCTLSAMTVALSGQEINSANYVLPITNNVSIHINSGTTTLKQSVALLPGTELTIAKNAVLDIAQGNGQINDLITETYGLVIYDSDEWYSGLNLGTMEMETGLQFAFQSSILGMRPLTYAPGRTYNRTPENDLKDALVDVNGKIVANGYIYTTLSGANIISSGKTGVLEMRNGAGYNYAAFQAQGGTTYGILMSSAALKNGDGSYLQTIIRDDPMGGDASYAAQPGDVFSYCAECDAWVKSVIVTFDANGGTGSMEPQVIENPCCGETLNINAFVNGSKEFDKWNTTASGSGTSYADGAVFDELESTTLYAIWKNTYAIRFLNEDGTLFEAVTVPAGSIPAPGSIPQKAADEQYASYKFVGWDLQVNGEFDGVADTVSAAASGVTYKAVFVGDELQTYDVVFYDEDGVTVLYTAEDVPYGTVPEYMGGTVKKIDCTTYSVKLPALRPVDGYKLQYTVTWTEGETVHTGDLVTKDHMCDTCGQELSVCTDEDDDGDHACDICGAGNITPCTDSVTDNDHTCDECGAENITAHSGTKVDAVTPTCVAGGNNAYWICDVCHKVFKEATFQTETTVAAEQLPADPDKHNLVYESQQEPTCTEDGAAAGSYCTLCEYATGSTVIPALGHKDSENDGDHTCDECTQENVSECADGNKDHACDDCAASMGTHAAAAGKHTCDYCGKTVTACADVTGDGDHLCDVCEETLSGCDDADRNHSCDECGLIVGTHTAAAGKHTCNYCGKTVTECSDKTGDGDHACDVCGKQNITACYDRDTDKDHKCDECGKDEITAHVAVVLEGKTADCEEDGLTEGAVCSVCGQTLVAQTVIPALGHSEKILPAVDPTCSKVGLTEGKSCVTCGEITLPQEEIAKLAHTPVSSEELPAMCDQQGMTAGVYCSVCNETISGRVVIPELGHDIKHYEAKKPTYTGVGWEAYDSCGRCAYTTYVEIPALGVPVTKNYSTFITNLEILEELAAAYVRQNPGKDPLNLIIKYIRTGVERYNSGSWGIMAGYEDPDFAKFVSTYEDEYNATVENVSQMIAVSGLKDVKNFKLPNGNQTDFGHMFGTMDITYHNNFGLNHADVGGWAGDVVDLLSSADRHNVSGDLEEMVAEIAENYLCAALGENDSFGPTDMYGDLDGYYLMDVLSKNGYETGDLTALMKAYFTVDQSDESRASYFLKNRLNGVSLRADVRDAVYHAYTGNKVVATLEGTREFNSTDLDTLKMACCYAFADYICQLAGDFVEVTDNKYFTVFSSEHSTLAPGITQDKKLATTKDNKQIAYYIATADLTRDDVQIFANYNKNDPTTWAMARVLDQANFAQEKYGNPESSYYIPNYNIIASINGAGYNMTTGEPGGLLVMNGVEYHSVNSNGFFGILKDGTPVIGTTEEYNTIYKGQVQEGIAGFGATLVLDGKIKVSQSDNYYADRASRTAVGITKTGKVVFMVLDGRQEPWSCGGSMQEIAQIMLEAGCVHAINLDGGGSTTYVAREAGTENLAVVSKPSDGIARSVSTSLIMVSTAPSSTAFDRALVDAAADYMTVGTKQQITAEGISATGNLVDLPEGCFWAVSDEKYGTITADGVFTALRNGDVEIRLMHGETAVGSMTMHIVIPDQVYFTKATMNAVYGQGLELPVKALYNGKEVVVLDSDLVFTLSNESAGTVVGRTFTGIEASGIKNVDITVTLAKNSSATSGTIALRLYKQGENSFDFEQAIGGNNQLAWDRQVSNATTEDYVTYEVVDPEQDMVTTYTFAIDMTQIPIPEQLSDLIYMLPGSDVEGASAWGFLMQLAERVSVLSWVKPVLYFDPNFEVDYSGLTLVNDYFKLTAVEFNEEENSLALTLNWIDQTQPIDVAMSNPLCLVSGLKLTPKADADWGTKSRLTAVHAGEIGYEIYLRASSLYTFCQKPENQATYGLKPFVNPNDESEKGGCFGSVYAEFQDSYTLIKSLKNGWFNEDGGFVYYVEGERLTGVEKADGYFYDFGTDGVNIGKTKFSGMITIDGVLCNIKNGELTPGWVTVGTEKYCFDENGAGYDGTVVLDEVELIFDNGKLIGGYSGFLKKSDGKTYHYQNGIMTFGWYQEGDKLYHFHVTTGVMTTGTKVYPDQEAKSKNAYYDFSDDGVALRSYFNGHGYYYWAGLPKINSWVKNGWDSDPDAWYRTNGSGHYVKGVVGKDTKEQVIDGKLYTTVRIAIDGVVYTFDNNNGKLLLGDVVNDNGTLYYYWAGEPITGGWINMNGNVYYADANGVLARGRKKIDGIEYVFANDGKLQAKAAPDMTAKFNTDYSKINLEVTGVLGYQSVYIVLSNGRGTYKLECTKSGTDKWTATANLCDYVIAGDYTFKAYGINAVGDTLLDQETMEVLLAVNHSYSSTTDKHCDICGALTKVENGETAPSVPMFRMYNPNSGEHFYTGSEEERAILVKAGWKYEGVGFNAPVEGEPVYRLYEPATGEHLYTMDRMEVYKLLNSGWNYEGVAWNTAEQDEVVQYRLRNPNATVGRYHFTSSDEERDWLISLGWIYERIGWYSCRE